MKTLEQRFNYLAQQWEYNIAHISSISEDAGNLEKMTNAWLSWAEKNGYL